MSFSSDGSVVGLQSDPLTALVCFPIHLCKENVEKSFFQNVLKTQWLKLTMGDYSSKTF